MVTQVEEVNKVTQMDQKASARNVFIDLDQMEFKETLVKKLSVPYARN